ncbi:MAG: UvrD-helicase domain-containing protein [Chthoniobacteraceae bacterium]|jgi:ATP-dependent exoDNAse (exonuclease V) beta subunit
MNQPLHDQPARERFRTELEVNFCVSAGAGVGKTTAIVRRVAELARREPEALSRLVVVTYTNSAANELRVRAQDELFRGGGGGDLLSHFSQAFFGTIHSFCVRLIRQYGAGLGIAPDFELLEEDDDEVWARYCESPMLDAVPLDREALDEVSRFISFDELLRLARKIDPARAARLLAGDACEMRPPLDFTESLADDGGRSKEKTRENQDSLRLFLTDFSEGASFLRIPQFERGSKTFHESYQRKIFPFASWLDRQAARLAARIALGYRDYRREQRLMTYADQIAWCRGLLDIPDVLEELRVRDSIVLLDEAQDTDAAMFAILSEVTRPPGASVGEWPERSSADPPRPGRFCFVGDEQQSIFSRANLAVYGRYIEAFAAGRGGERLEFSVTMRCPQRVIGAVNAIFFHADRLRQTHFSFRELHPKPDCVEGAAWLLPIPTLAAGKRDVKAEFREECRQVAAFLNDYGPSGLGVDKWSDVAILCPRLKWLQAAADVFIESGLPCRLISRQRIQLELPERSWPAALLHVLLNPWDRFELIGVLREIFAVSDVELADAQADNQPFTFWSTRGLSPRLAAALAMLRDLHAAAPPAGALSLAQYVDRVLDATRLAARLAAIGQRHDALPRLQLEALQAEAAGAPLRKWVAQLVRNLERPAPQAAGVDDEILLLTSQKAKGQEWPVVIPLGLGRYIQPRSPEYPSVEENAGEIAVHISKVTVRSEEREPREEAFHQELQRLFYVTLTRAKSLLILPDSLRLYSVSKGSFLDLCKWEGSGWERLFDAPHPLS